MLEVLNKDINSLSIDKQSIEILSNNGINSVMELCKCSRLDLADKGLVNSQINNIRITLQLKGLDLKPNHAKRNILLNQ